ncbi:MAG: hypothetical protein LBS84_11545 [Clostridiales bacterium]|jgi:4-hydroxy-2-oxoheptanedioate aldolase|nr:hypothetical protein [Clostridiales bacterium]
MNAYCHYGAIDRRVRRNIKQMVSEGNTPVGMGLAVPSPFMVELAAVAGFDFIWIDMEHNLFNPETVQNIIRAADSAGMATCARIAQKDQILPLLDFGMVGFTIPHVHTALETKELVDIIKYAPDGRRGFCTGGRAQRFGAMPHSEYIKEIADEVMLSIMIEDKEGLENAEAILDVPGIDYLQLGPGDLSQAVGVIGQFDHPLVTEKKEWLLSLADKRGIKRAGTGAPITIAEDKTVLLAALQDIIKKHRAK